MAYKQFKCIFCGKEFYSFPEDLNKKLHSCSKNISSFVELPHYPVVVHATNSFMSTEFMLDSTWTIHELDRILNFEVSEEKQLKSLHDFRISN
jgi:hypothetical protein